MSLIICPECKREISNQAQNCPQCGYPVNHISENAIPDPPVPEEACDSTVQTQTETKKNINYKVLIGVGITALIVAILFFSSRMSSKVTAKNVSTNALYYSELDVGVKLGQSKSTVDKLLGVPEEMYDSFVYDGYLYVTYTGGNVDSIAIEYPNDRWNTYSGIDINSSANQIVEALGEPTQKLDGGKQWFYQRNGHVIGFSFAGKNLLSIYIYTLDGGYLLSQDEVEAQNATGKP